ncbi:MAG: hypothetical protein EAY75_09125 [Bacteroidetes bacterium]|nr:MAG: hypothetical protein EAY75_09125 [Bacteroidota bacterium]
MLGGSKYRFEVQIDDEKKPLNGMKGLSGVTYSYQDTRFYAKSALEGVWTPGTSNVVLRETKIIDLRIAGGMDGCLMTCYLDYVKDGDKEYLEGTYSSTNARTGANCGGGKVTLERVEDTDFELEPFLLTPPQSKGKVKPGQDEFLVKKPTPTNPPKHTPPVAKTTPPKPKALPPTAKKASPLAKAPPKNAPPVAKAVPAKPKPAPATAEKAIPLAKAPPKKINVPKAGSADSLAKINITVPEKPKLLPSPNPAKPKIAPPAVLVQRSNELFESIETDSKTLTISFYDNGEVDGDIISVYDNNRLIASKKALTTKPVTVTVQLSDDEPEHEIVMVAENLGSIPPNTALMIVQAGSQRYNVRLSSTEQKNALVRFKYKP